MPELPISKTQLDRLGDRLRDAAETDSADRDLFMAVLDAYDGALKVVKQHLRDLGFFPTDRLKTIGTTVEKLRRSHTSRLKTIHDLAGARVVALGGLRDQDAAVMAFCERCAADGPPPVVIDRRADPRAGYRAVHVVAKIDRIPVEVQFRTELQNLWAQSFERLADTWGRQIRYGGDPADGARDAVTVAERRELVEAMLQVSKILASYEEAQASVEVQEARAWQGRERSGAPPGGPVEVSDEQRAMYLAYAASSDRAAKASLHLLTWMAQVVDKEDRSR